MRKVLLLLALVVTFTSGFNNKAHAGIGLSAKAVVNLANGDFLASAIGAGLGVASVSYGLKLVNTGKIGWGVFFLVLEEQNVIMSEDKEALTNADVSTKEAFAEIISSKKSEEEKQAELKVLLN